MCHKLLQVYACGHLKDVCTTPCPHALATGHRIPQDNSPELSRSPSVISTTTSPATPPRKDDRQDLPSQRHSLQAQPARPSPLRISMLGEQAPAFRFVAPGDAPPPGSTPTSPSSNEQSPTFSTTSTLNNTPSPATLFFQADSEMYASSVDPSFCAYHFPRYLPQSKVPCLACYGRSEWEGYRRAWMRSYRELHPSVKEYALEVSGGV